MISGKRTLSDPLDSSISGSTRVVLGAVSYTHLYNLKEWDDILTEERRKELYKESRNSTTVVKGKKIGRNDP